MMVLKIDQGFFQENKVYLESNLNRLGELYIGLSL